MQHRSSRLSEYLRDRRAVTFAAQRDHGDLTQRRVQGLRREEVAEKAGISLAYYVRLEQGRSTAPSHEVLLGLRRALDLDQDAFTYLVKIAKDNAIDVGEHRAAPDREIIDFVRQIRGAGALLIDVNFDVYAFNGIARVLIPSLERHPMNLLEWIYRTAHSKVLNLDETRQALRAVVRYLSASSDARLKEIVDTIAAHNGDFGPDWARHDVRIPTGHAVRIHLAQHGEVTLECRTLLVSSRNLAILVLARDGSERGDVALNDLQRLSDARDGRERSRTTLPSKAI